MAAKVKLEPLVVSAIEAAEMLRTRVDVVYRLLEVGEVPAYRIGSNWKVPITKLQQYVEERAEAKPTKGKWQFRKERNSEAQNSSYYNRDLRDPGHHRSVCAAR